MLNIKDKIKKIHKSHVLIAGVLLLILLAVSLLWFNDSNSVQAESAMVADVQMDSESGYIIIDARTQEEYDQGHIPGAILIPEYEIADRAEKELPDKDQLILVYCRSGRRSKIAAEELVKLGYTNVKEFGGIIDWEYETVKD